jgi:hypothetical protein
MNSWKVVVGFGVGLLLALPARADFNAKVKYTCFLSADQTTKLGQTKGTNDDLIAACLGVVTGNPIIADYSVVLDTDTNAVTVVRNCDSQVACTLTAAAICADATTSAFNGAGTKTKARCVYPFQNFGKFTIEGSLSCRQRGSDDSSTETQKLDSKCDGGITFDGVPCSITVNSGKTFEQSGTCPE